MSVRIFSFKTCASAVRTRANCWEGTADRVCSSLPCLGRQGALRWPLARKVLVSCMYSTPLFLARQGMRSPTRPPWPRLPAELPSGRSPSRFRAPHDFTRLFFCRGPHRFVTSRTAPFLLALQLVRVVVFLFAASLFDPRPACALPTLGYRKTKSGGVGGG